MATPRRRVSPKNLPSAGRPNTGRGRRQSLLSPSRWAEINEAWNSLSAPPEPDAPYTYSQQAPAPNPADSSNYQYPPAAFAPSLDTPASSRVSAIAYYDDNSGGQTYIFVRFKNERPPGSPTLYRYDANYAHYLAFEAAPSKGKYVNSVLNFLPYSPESNPPNEIRI